MKNQNFYMRVISLLLVILAVLFYNSSMKAQANEKEIAALTDKVDTLQEQQNELLSALETSYVNRMQNQAASAGSGSSDTDTAGDDKTTDTSDGNVSDADAEDTATADSDNVYKDGTYTGEAEGYGGTIQVEVTLTGDEITSINVVSAPGEDSAYLSQAESVIDSILSAQSTDVDTVSGATFSSTGILNAVDAALGKEVRLMRAGIQLAFFIAAPSLFSTAFAGIKSIFLAIAAGQPVEWNSFLTVMAVLLIFTCFFGRHFCGYACAFGSFGDAVYEGFSWIRMKCFHKKKKPALSEKMVHGLQKVKYIVLALILLSCLTDVYGKLTGTSPWDVFSMLTAGRLPNSKYLVGIVLLVLIIVGMCTQERFFCQFLCPMGAVFALMPILPGALFRRNREKCPPKCGLCKKRCPAHLDIDGDTGRSGECLCCHACAAACPRKNIHIGTIEEK